MHQCTLEKLKRKIWGFSLEFLKNFSILGSLFTDFFFRPLGFTFFWIEGSPWQLLDSNPSQVETRTGTFWWSRWRILWIALVWQRRPAWSYSPLSQPTEPQIQHCDYANEAASSVFNGIMFIIYLLPVDSLSRLASILISSRFERFVTQAEERHCSCHLFLRLKAGLALA